MVYKALSTSGGGGGAVSSVSNVDGSLTISPTTGVIIASLNVNNANTWTAQQEFDNNIKFGSGSTIKDSTGVDSIKPDTHRLANSVGVDSVNYDIGYLYASNGTDISIDYGARAQYGIGGASTGVYCVDYSGSKNASFNISYDATHTYVQQQIQAANLTASRAVVSDASKNIISSATTATELGYVSGVTSAIQTQINSFKPVRLRGAYTNATNGLTNITDLTLQLGVGSYAGSVVLWGNNNLTTEGMQIAFGGSATISAIEFGFLSTPIGAVVGITPNSTAAGTAINLSTIANSDRAIVIPVFVTTTGGGTLTVQAAENSAHVSGTVTINKAYFSLLPTSN